MVFMYIILPMMYATLYKNTNDAQFFDDIDFHLTNQNIVYFSGRKIMYTTDNGSTVVDFPYEFQSKYTSEIDLQKVNDAHNDFRFNNVESDGITFLSTNHGLIIPYMGNWLQEPAPISNVDGTWKASTYNNNSVASIKQRPNVNSPKLKLLISGYMYIDEIYNLELFAKIPVGCGIKINLKSTLNANQQIIYDSGIISSSFEGIIRTSSFNIIDELYTSPDITNDNISLYIEIEAMVNSNMYNQNDEMIIDNLSILKKYLIDKSYINYVKLVVDKTNSNNLYALIQYQPTINSASKVNIIEKFNSVTNIWEPKLNLFEYSSAALRTKVEFEQSKSINDAFYYGAIQMYMIKGLENGINKSSTSVISSTTLGDSYLHADIRDLKVISKNNEDILFVGNDAGVYSTIINLNTNLNSIPWIGINQNLSIANFYGIGVSNNSGLNIFGGTQDNGTHRHLNGVWKNIRGGDGGDIYINLLNPNNIYGGDNGRLINSNDNGNTWQSTDLCGNTSPIYLGYEVYRAINYSDFNNYFIGTNISISGGSKLNGVYRTIDGCNFEKITPAIYDNSNLSIYPKSLSKSNVNVLYAISLINTASLKEVKIIKTVNAQDIASNVIWIDITGDLNSYVNQGYGQYISSIHVDPNDENIVYVAISGYSPTSNGNRLFRSVNGGANWENITINLPDFPIMYIESIGNTIEEIFIGTDVGLYYKNSNLIEWEPISNNLPMCIITDIEIDKINGKMYVGTFGRGVWESVLPCSAPSATMIVNSENETWNNDMRITSNIEIATGAKLTIKKNVLLNDNATITIKPGGKLKIEGGTISVGCGYMWNGIIVEGNANLSQSESNQGVIEMVANSKIKHARQAIKSINGGIVIAHLATFENCRGAIQIKNYHAPIVNGYEAKNISRITMCNFVCNAPMRDPIYTDAGVREGMKWAITLNNVRGVRILSNNFANTLDIRPDLKGNGLSSYMSSYILNNNTFNNLSYGVESAGIFNPFDNIHITNNTFNDVQRSITESSNTLSYIAENSFNMLTLNFNEYVPNAWAINSRSSAAFYYHSNIIDGANNPNTYGIVARNAAFGQNLIAYNSINAVGVGTQPEDWCRELNVSCNNYDENVQTAWIVDPEVDQNVWNEMKEQGNFDDELPQAGNLFYNNSEYPNFKSHIYSNLNFKYNAAEFPDEAYPESHNILVDAKRVPGSDNSISCPSILTPCEYPCNDLIQFIQATQDSDYKIFLTNLLFKSYADSGYVSGFRAIAENIEYPNKDQILIPFLIGNSQISAALELIDTIQITNQIRSDFKNFYEILYNIYQSSESGFLDTLSNSNLTVLMELQARDMYYADVAQYLMANQTQTTNFKEPEILNIEESNLSLQIDTNKLNINSTKGVVLNISPNPIKLEELIISSLIEDYNPFSKYQINITDILGRNIYSFTINDEDFKLKFYPVLLKNGVYLISLYNENVLLKTERLLKFD